MGFATWLFGVWSVVAEREEEGAWLTERSSPRGSDDEWWCGDAAQRSVIW